ncbi:MAG: hypothetical protein ABF381_11880 [Akkermansiaceae bacterium]
MFALTFTSILLGTLATRSQTDAAATHLPEEPPPRMIRTQAEFIEMPHTIFTRLMAQPRTSANDSDLRAACAKLIEAGEAKIIESLCVNALPGQSATSENIHEFIYPTDYDLGGWFVDPETGQVSEPVKPKSIVGGPPLPPTAFDTKNTGSIFKVEAQIDTRTPIVDLKFTPKIVHHTGQDLWGLWEKNGVRIENSMPRFYILSVKSGVTVVAGQPLMVAGLSPRNKDGWINSSRKVMTFIRADIITIEK